LPNHSIIKAAQAAADTAPVRRPPKEPHVAKTLVCLVAMLIVGLPLASAAWIAAAIVAF
jgi:hypothetical protein